MCHKALFTTKTGSSRLWCCCWVNDICSKAGDCFRKGDFYGVLIGANLHYRPSLIWPEREEAKERNCKVGIKRRDDSTVAKELRYYCSFALANLASKLSPPVWTRRKEEVETMDLRSFVSSSYCNFAPSPSSPLLRGQIENLALTEHHRFQ